MPDTRMRRRLGRKWVMALGIAISVATMPGERAAAQVPSSWTQEWPKTDFSKRNVDLSEIKSGGPPKDGIPAIDKPVFVSIAKAKEAGLQPKEAVISVRFNGDARAYPLRVMMWHEIVNDTVGGRPVTITWCPLCNSAVVFDRRLDGRVLDFGTTGKLRKSDLVMYDRQTESWWQQFLGKAIVGALAGKQIEMLPMRVESFERFAARHADGKVLTPNDPAARQYGRNPYTGYDRRNRPYFDVGGLPKGVPPLERVVVIGDRAWTFSLVKAKRRIEVGDLIITWEPGQASALDSPGVAAGRDIGNVVVQRRTKDGKLVDSVHDVSFAFAFHAFRRKGKIHTLPSTD